MSRRRLENDLLRPDRCRAARKVLRRKARGQAVPHRNRLAETGPVIKACHSRRARHAARRPATVRARAMEEFHRIRRLPPYVFEQVNRAKAAARNAGADIIDLGMGNPGSAGARACHRQAEGDARQAAHRPLFVLERHSRPAPRAGGLLRAPLRREAQSRHADRRDARLEGRLRQRRAGDHRARRRRAGARIRATRSTPSAS